MDADKLVEAVALAIMAAPCRCGCDDDEPETGEHMARAALAAVVAAAGLDAAALPEIVSVISAEANVIGRPSQEMRKAAALLRALADVAEAQR